MRKPDKCHCCYQSHEYPFFSPLLQHTTQCLPAAGAKLSVPGIFRESNLKSCSRTISPVLTKHCSIPTFVLNLLIIQWSFNWKAKQCIFLWHYPLLSPKMGNAGTIWTRKNPTHFQFFLSEFNLFLHPAYLPSALRVTSEAMLWGWAQTQAITYSGPPPPPSVLRADNSSILPTSMHYARVPLEINTLLCKSCSLIPIAALASKSLLKVEAKP